MAKILLAWELGAGFGHCANLFPIAEQLVKQGHQVVLAARDLATARRVFGETAVTYAQAPMLVGHSLGSVSQPQTFAQILHNTGFGTDEHLQVLADAWVNLLDVFRPDAVLCEHAPHALLASQVRNMRCYLVGTGFFSPPDVTPMPNIRPDSGDGPSSDAVHYEQTVLGRINAYLEANSKSPLARLSQLYAEVDANFLLTYAELDHYPQRTGGEYFGIWSLPGGITPPWPSGSGKRVFAYLKPPTKTWRLAELLMLLVELELPTVAFVPEVDPVWLRQFSTRQLEIVTERVDIRYAAQHCDLAVLNGNAGTSTELLLAGVPQLLVPLHLEQAVFCEQVARFGAALVARPDQPAQMAARLFTLLGSNSYQLRAKSFEQRYADQLPRQQLQNILQRVLPS